MRVVVRTFSELCITVGTLIVLFVVYVLFWTGVKADTAMDDQIDQLQDQWAKGSVSGPKTSRRPPRRTARARVRTSPRPYKDGKPFAVMYIPRLGFTWNKPVLEGTEDEHAQEGPRPLREHRAARAAGELRGRRPSAHVRGPVQGFPQAAAGRRGGADRRDDLVHVSDRQKPLQNSAPVT